MNALRRSTRQVQIASAAVILAGIYICLLAGSATFSRLGGPNLTLRSVGLAVMVMFCLLWRATPAGKTGIQSAATYMALINLVFVYLMVSSLWAPPGAGIFERFASIATMAAYVNLAAWVMSRSDRRILDQLWIVVFSTSFTFLVGALVAGPGLQGRYAAFGGGPNVFVRIMLLGMIASLALYLIYSIRWILVGLPLFLAGALLSGSRGGLVALGVFAIALVPLIRRLHWSGTLRIAAVLFVSTLAALVIAPTSVRQLLYERFVVLTIERQYDSGRGTYYSAATELFKERPAFGWGLGGYTEQTGLHYAHNLFLGFAAEGGIIGLAFLIISLIAPIAAIASAASPVPTSALLGLVAALCILVSSLFSGDYYDSRFLWFFLIFAVYASRAVGYGRLKQVAVGKAHRNSRAAFVVHH